MSSQSPRTSGGFAAIVKVAAAQSAKKKYIRPGYVPAIVRFTRITDAAGAPPEIRLAVNVGSNGTGEGDYVKLGNAAGDLVANNGVTFHNDEGEEYVEFGSVAMTTGSWLVEMDGGSQGGRGVLFVDTSKTATYRTGTPPKAADGGLFKPKSPTTASGVADNQESDWYFQEA